ncbi:MAG: c(7)-type cytochrome triheme domain-containing protein [Thermodesulfobacteriota bacterium]
MISRPVKYSTCIITLFFLIIQFFGPAVYAGEVSDILNNIIIRKDSHKKKEDRSSYTSKKIFFSNADKIGEGEHSFAVLELPTDRFGLVNWVKATKQGKVAPIVSIDRNRKHRFYEGVIIYNATSPTREDVIFPHDVHTYFLDCDSCHPKPFSKTVGKAKILMIRIKRGRFCGKCHGKIAFPIEDCDRCHVLPKANIKW